MGKGKFSFLEIGYTSFPLRDIGRKFKLVDTIDISVKKSRINDLKKIDEYVWLQVNYREIEKSVWEEARKDKELLKEADWLVISMLTEFGDEIRVSLDMLKDISKKK